MRTPLPSTTSTACRNYPDLGYTPVLHGRQEGMFRSLFSHFVGVVEGKVGPGCDGPGTVWRRSGWRPRSNAPLESGRTEMVDG